METTNYFRQSFAPLNFFSHLQWQRLAVLAAMCCIGPAMSTSSWANDKPATDLGTLSSPWELKAELLANRLHMTGQQPGMTALVSHPESHHNTQPLALADEPKDNPVPKNRQKKTSIFDINKPRKNFNLKLNLWQLYLGSINILPEIRAGAHNTVTPGVAFGKRNESGVEFEYFTLTPEYRRYYYRDSKGDFHKGYFGVYLRYRNEQSSTASVYNAAGLGLTIGHQFLVLDMLSLDFFAGAGYYFYSDARRGRFATEKEPGRGDIRIGICLGIAPE